MPRAFASAGVRSAIPSAGTPPQSHQACDRAAFDRVYAETFPAAWRTARRLGVPAMLMDDVLQDVYIVVYRRLEQFEERSGMKAWIIGILINVVHNYRRQKRRKGAGSALYSCVAEPDSVLDEARSPADFASQRQAAEIVSELLQALDPQRAAIFVAVELEGMTVAEVAKAHDLTLGTAYSRLRSARVKFERARQRKLARYEVRLTREQTSGTR